jgi:glycosyltransferase involved in cell wall biosynthesis
VKPAAFTVGLIGPLPPPSGGMANQTRQLAQLLRGEGIAVEVVQVNAPYRPQWIGAIKGVRAVARLLPYLVRLWRAAGRAQLFHVMANSGWSWHLYAAPAVWIASMRGCPVVVNYRGGEAQSFFAHSFFWVEKTLRRVNALVVPSGFLQQVFRQQGVAVTLVPNIIDLERFRARAEQKRGSASPHLIITRNLEAIYDVATAIRAFHIVQQEFPAARLSIAGSGPEEQNLKALVASLGIAEAVTFLGRLDNEKMGALYACADLMLNASLVDNMPISILESLASGVPVVTTNVGGIPHLVEHERTALLVAPRDPEAMARAILALLRDSAKAAALAHEGLKLVQPFAWVNVKKQWLDVYSRLATERVQFEPDATRSPTIR